MCCLLDAVGSLVKVLSDIRIICNYEFMILRICYTIAFFKSPIVQIHKGPFSCSGLEEADLQYISIEGADMWLVFFFF